jgi:PAS domain-containing protein
MPANGRGAARNGATIPARRGTALGRAGSSLSIPTTASGAQGLGRAAETGSLEFEGRIFHASEGRHRHFRTRALPVRDGRGRISEWLGTSTDVDDILQLQEHQSVLVANSSIARAI